MREFHTIDELRALVGQEVALSDWVLVDQARINAFADATADHQWIHVDAERCRRESPFGAPVAHGFLTLSLISGMFDNAVRLTGARMVINYGLNKVRFPAPVPVDSKLRARMTLASITPVDGERPVCVAELLIRRYD